MEILRIRGARTHNLKNIDLIAEYGDEGFWKNFAEGIDHVNVNEGYISVTLKP